VTDQFALTDDQIAIQDMARKFTADRITPFAAQWDEDCHYPVEVWKAAGELGFGAIYVSEESGGIGLGRLEAALIMEAMAYGCPATSAYISIHNMAAWMIDRFGGDEIKARFLPGLVSMEQIASYCLTEPGSGSDAAALKTTARLDGDHYVLNGTKQFISGAGYNDIYVCMVRTSDNGAKGISCLLAAKDTPGLTPQKPERKMGMRSSHTATIQLDGARVPADRLIGVEGQGFRIAMSALDGGRLGISACAVGVAQAALDTAVAYSKERRQFGQRIADAERAVIGDADNVTRIRFVHGGAVLRHKGNGVIDSHQLVRTDLFDFHATLKAARTHAQKRNTVAMFWIHIGLNFEHKT